MLHAPDPRQRVRNQRGEFAAAVSALLYDEGRRSRHGHGAGDRFKAHRGDAGECERGKRRARIRRHVHPATQGTVRTRARSGCEAVSRHFDSTVTVIPRIYLHFLCLTFADELSKHSTDIDLQGNFSPSSEKLGKARGNHPISITSACSS